MGRIDGKGAFVAGARGPADSSLKLPEARKHR
jgi:hypothetical protein